MTAISITRTTTQAARGRRRDAAHPAGTPTRLERWSADRRRRFLTEQRRHDSRDRSDRYLDRLDDTPQRQTLVAFVQR
jgi:hypothetical protein